MKEFLKNNHFLLITINKMHYKIHYFKFLISTQDKAEEFAEKGLSNTVILAGNQIKGRGRFNRKWHSDKGGLFMSILLRPKNVRNLQYLTFIAAISVRNSIKKTTNLQTNIKWPNDLHYKGRKLCGIITEGKFGKNNFVSVGIGLNVNQAKFRNEIRDTAISLRMIKHRVFDIKKLAGSICKEFFFLYKQYYSENKLEKIRNIWEKYCDTINKRVTVISQSRKIYGKAVGIDTECNLLIKLKNNRIIKIIEGDINVRY